jgi:hypothetical protein
LPCTDKAAEASTTHKSPAQASVASERAVVNAGDTKHKDIGLGLTRATKHKNSGFCLEQLCSKTVTTGFTNLILKLHLTYSELLLLHKYYLNSNKLATSSFT